MTISELFTFSRVRRRCRCIQEEEGNEENVDIVDSVCEPRDSDIREQLIVESFQRFIIFSQYFYIIIAVSIHSLIESCVKM